MAGRGVRPATPTGLVRAPEHGRNPTESPLTRCDGYPEGASSAGPDSVGEWLSGWRPWLDEEPASARTRPPFGTRHEGDQVGRATANARWAFLGLGVKVGVQ